MKQISAAQWALAQVEAAFGCHMAEMAHKRAPRYRVKTEVPLVALLQATLVPEKKSAIKGCSSSHPSTSIGETLTVDDDGCVGIAFLYPPSDRSDDQ